MALLPRDTATPTSPTRICVEYASAITGDSFSVPFEYLDQAHVYIYTKSTQTDITDQFQFQSDGILRSIQDQPGPFIIFRYTPRNELREVFNNTTSISADTFNSVLTGLLYAIQEGAEAIALVDELVDLGHLTPEIRDRLLPPLPAEGNRDGKIAEFNGNDLTWTHANDSGLRLTGTEIGAEAFRNVPTNLDQTEKGQLYSALDLTSDLVNASLANNQVTFTKRDSGTFDLDLPNALTSASIRSRQLVFDQRTGDSVVLDLPGDDRAFTDATFNQESSRLTFTRGNGNTLNLDLPEGGDAEFDLLTQHRLDKLEDISLAVQTSPETQIWSLVDGRSDQARFESSGSSRTLAEASANPSSTSWVTRLLSNPGGHWIVIRLPAGTAPSAYRLLINGTNDTLVSHTTFLGTAAGSDYYQYQYPASLPLYSIRLQSTNNRNHITNTIWLGSLDSNYITNNIVTQNNLFPILETSIDGKLPVSVNRDTTNKVVRIGLDGFNTEYLLDQTLPTRNNASRGKLLGLSAADEDALELYDPGASGPAGLIEPQSITVGALGTFAVSSGARTPLPITGVSAGDYVTKKAGANSNLVIAKKSTVQAFATVTVRTNLTSDVESRLGPQLIPTGPNVTILSQVSPYVRTGSTTTYTVTIAATFTVSADNSEVGFSIGNRPTFQPEPMRVTAISGVAIMPLVGAKGDPGADGTAELDSNHKTVSVTNTTDLTFTNLLGSAESYDQNTVYFVTLTDGTSTDVTRSIAFEGQDFNGKQVRLTGNNDITFFSDGTKLDVRSDDRRPFTAAITWFRAIPSTGQGGGGGGGLSTVATDTTITGTGATDDPLKVAEPYTAAERTKLAALRNYTLTDDAVLDLAEATRTTSDRGLLLGVSETNQNELALLPTPESVDLTEEVEHLEILTSDLDPRGQTVEYAEAPAAEAQWTAQRLNTGLGGRLSALSNRANKLTAADLALLPSLTWSTSAAISADSVIVLRVKPSLINITNYGVSMGSADVMPHDPHTYRQIGSDRSWTYLLVGDVIPPNPGYNLFARKKVTNYITEFHGGVAGPMRDRVNEIAESVIDLERVQDSNTRTLAKADKAGWTEFGSDSRLYTDEPRDITLNNAELSLLADRDTLWSQEGSQSHQTAAVVRIKRNGALAKDYVFVSTTEGAVKFWAHNYIGQDANYNYFLPHKNTSQRGEGAKIEKITATTHTIYHGRLGQEVIDSLPKPAPSASAELFLAFANGTVTPVKSLRTDYFDQVFGTSLSGNTVRRDIRFLIKGVLPELTQLSQFASFNIEGNTVRAGSLTLEPGEYINSNFTLTNGDVAPGHFSLYVPLTNSQLGLIRDNSQGTNIRFDLNYLLSGINKRLRLSINWLSAAQARANPITPHIPPSSIIGGVGASPITGISSSTLLPTTNLVVGKTYFQSGNGVAGTAAPGLYLRTGSGWTVLNKKRTAVLSYEPSSTKFVRDQAYLQLGVLPLMDDDDQFSISVTGISSFRTRRTYDFLWKHIWQAPKATAGSTLVPANAGIILKDTEEDGTLGSPTLYFSFTADRGLLIAIGSGTLLLRSGTSIIAHRN